MNAEQLARYSDLTADACARVIQAAEHRALTLTIAALCVPGSTPDTWAIVNSDAADASEVVTEIRGALAVYVVHGSDPVGHLRALMSYGPKGGLGPSILSAASALEAEIAKGSQAAPEVGGEARAETAGRELKALRGRLGSVDRPGMVTRQLTAEEQARMGYLDAAARTISHPVGLEITIGANGEIVQTFPPSSAPSLVVSL